MIYDRMFEKWEEIISSKHHKNIKIYVDNNCEDAVGIPRKNWKELDDYQGRCHMEFGGNSGSKLKRTLEEWIIFVESTISTKWTKTK